MTKLQLTTAESELLNALFEKWFLTVLSSVCDGPKRFSELQRELDPITNKALSKTLKSLETRGLVERRVLPSRPVGVEYEATGFGRTLKEPLAGLFAWVSLNADAVG